MKMVRQRSGNDCAIACAAMLCGNTWEETLAYCPDLHGVAEKGASLKMLEDIMWWASGVDDWNTSRMSSAPPGEDAILLTRKKGQKWGHWVAWDGKNVFDPHTGTITKTPPNPIIYVCMRDGYGRKV